MAMTNGQVLDFLENTDLGSRIHMSFAPATQQGSFRTCTGTLYFVHPCFYIRDTDGDGDEIIKVLDPTHFIFTIEILHPRRSASRARCTNEATTNHAKRDREAGDQAAPDQEGEQQTQDRAAAQAAIHRAEQASAALAQAAERAAKKKAEAAARIAAARQSLHVTTVPTQGTARPGPGLSLQDIDARVQGHIDTALDAAVLRFAALIPKPQTAPTVTPTVVVPTVTQALPRASDEVDNLLNMSRMNAALLRGEEHNPRQQLCTGLSVPVSLGQPWVVFSGVHYVSDAVRNPTISGIAGWRLDLAGARTNAEIMVGNTGAGHLVEAASIKLRLAEEAFEANLGRLMVSNPRDKQDFFLMFHAGAMLMEAWASAKMGWAPGGSRVIKDFITAWDLGFVDFSKLWPKTPFRQQTPRTR